MYMGSRTLYEAYTLKTREPGGLGMRYVPAVYRERGKRRLLFAASKALVFARFLVVFSGNTPNARARDPVCSTRARICVQAEVQSLREIVRASVKESQAVLLEVGAEFQEHQIAALLALPVAFIIWWFLIAGSLSGSRNVLGSFQQPVSRFRFLFWPELVCSRKLQSMLKMTSTRFVFAAA